jgi:hypothetical protein
LLAPVVFKLTREYFSEEAELSEQAGKLDN